MKTELSEIFFQVNKVPSVDLMQNAKMEFNSDNSYAIVGVWPDRQKTLNFCSDVYQLVENKAVLEPLIPVLEERFKHLDLFVSNDKDAQFSVRISPVTPTLSLRSEVTFPMVTFINSYDGKVQAQATGGLIRYFVDAKGEVQVTYSSYLKNLSFAYKFKHNNDSIYDMLELSNKIDSYLGDFSKVTEQIEKMKQFEISEKKVSKFLEKMANGTIFPLKELEETKERVIYESMILDRNPNLWTIYNAMNYITENSEKSLTKKMRMDVDAKIYVNMLEYMESINKRVEKKLIAA